MLIRRSLAAMLIVIVAATVAVAAASGSPAAPLPGGIAFVHHPGRDDAFSAIRTANGSRFAVVASGYPNEKFGLELLPGSPVNQWPTQPMVFDLGAGRDVPMAATSSPSSEVYMVGATVPSRGTSTASVLAIQPNGTPDPLFGSNGVARPNLVAGRPYQQLTGAAMQSNGDLVVAGEACTAAVPHACVGVVARLLPNGTLDSAFGTGGVTTIQHAAGASDRLEAVTVLPDDSIVAVGSALVNAHASSRADFLAARLTAGGVPDTGFDGDGIKVADGGSGGGMLGRLTYNAQHYAATGTVVAIGSYDVHGYAHPVAFRIAANGAFLAAYGGRSRMREQTIYTGFDGNEIVAGAEYDAAGHVYLVAESDAYSDTDLWVARLTPSGTYDRSFDDRGVAIIDTRPGAMDGESGAGVIVEGSAVYAIGASGAPADGHRTDVVQVHIRADHSHVTSRPAGVQLIANNRVRQCGFGGKPECVVRRSGMRVHVFGYIDHAHAQEARPVLHVWRRRGAGYSEVRELLAPNPAFGRGERTTYFALKQLRLPKGRYALELTDGPSAFASDADSYWLMFRIT